MKVKVLIVEDELIVAEEIKETLILSNFDIVGIADNCEDALHIADNKTPDIVLLDINIKGNEDGISTAEKIKLKHEAVAIIFLTAFSDTLHLNRAKATKPAAYIVKPFDAQNLTVAIDLAFSNLQHIDEVENEPDANTVILKDRIFIKEDGIYHKLLLDDILYIEAVGSYCEIHTQQKKYTFSFNLKKLDQKISHTSIARVHRSYIVNMDKVDAINGNQIFIDDHGIPIGNSYRNDFLDKFNLI